MTDAPPVHLYMPQGLTFEQRIMCGNPDKGINTHVTEHSRAVTCPTCRELMRAAEQNVTEEGESSWPS